MAMELADLDLNKTYTYADYLKWQFQDRVELIKGRIFKMSPAPNLNHQEIAGNIYRRIGNYLEDKPCRVFISPFDVRFPRKSGSDSDIVTVLQPDVCVVCDNSKLDIKGCNGAPDIVIEVLSPANNKKELKNKYEIYEEAGVKEYLIVFPRERTVQLFTLEDGAYRGSRYMYAGDSLTFSVLPGFTLNIAQLFSGLLEE